MNFFNFAILLESRVRTQIIRRGEILYHGTSSKENFDIPDGPAWFSRSEGVAKNFAGYHSGSFPRINKYLVIRQIPRLLTIFQKKDFENALGEDYPTWESNDLAQSVCEAGYNGWVIPNNYPNGDDIMLCYPEQWVKAA